MPAALVSLAGVFGFFCLRPNARMSGGGRGVYLPCCRGNKRGPHVDDWVIDVFRHDFCWLQSFFCCDCDCVYAALTVKIYLVCRAFVFEKEKVYLLFKMVFGLTPTEKP